MPVLDSRCHYGVQKGVCHFLARHCGVPGYESVGLQVTDSSWLERIATADGLKCAGAKCFWRLQCTISANPTVAVIGTADIGGDLPRQP